MSATNRGAVRKESDFYATPEAAFKPLLPHIKNRCWLHWEPACGDGRLVIWMNQFGINARGNDLNSGYDFLKDKATYPCIITNPPFSIAKEFVTHARKLATDSVYMLLRLNFLGSQKRHDWWLKNEPDALFVLSWRPDFTGEGGDACEYAWFYWGKDHRGIHHLPEYVAPVDLD